MAELIPLDASDYSNAADGVAIVCMPTGLVWSVQAGGISCEHPEVEGFPLTIFDHGEGEKIDDCKWGCWACSGKNDEYREKYGQAIDKFLSECINGILGNYATYKFDYERKKEVMEGWWPVLITFNGNVVGSGEKVFKGYLHMCNCD